MTRGNQRDNDRAKAQAKAAKNAKPEKGAGGSRIKDAMDHADRMREKQRKADLKA